MYFVNKKDKWEIKVDTFTEDEFNKWTNINSQIEEY